MIYFEDKTGIVEFNNSKEAVIKYNVTFWSLYAISKYGTYLCVCNADTIEELYIWADLHGLKVRSPLFQGGDTRAVPVCDANQMQQ